MKALRVIVLSLLCMACDGIFNDKRGIDVAQKAFIREVQYMTEEDALSKEIGYYKDPEITVKYKVRDLTGKDVIHECNLMLKENEKEEEDLRTGRTWIIKTWNVEDAKYYAIKHPDKICGAEFYFEGVFTHYGNGYGTRKARVLLMYTEDEDKWYVLQK